MATVNIMKSKRSQTRAGLAFTLSYCKRDKKTLYEGRKLVSGINCIPESAYHEMMNTKMRYGKTDGRMFYHITQSFHPDEPITPELAHEIALRFAKENFGDYEVLVATHTDKSHIHSHLVVNSVSCETGYKYHSDNENIERLRQASDRLCLEYSLSVVEPKAKSNKQMSAREYHSASRGESWKMQLIVTIEEAMKYARSKEHFIALMEAEGYEVKWTDERKNITYTTTDGRKCRDSKLHEEKFLKENMEYEFRMRAELYGQAQSEEYTADTPNRGADRNDSHRADQPERMGAPDGSNAAFDRAHSRFEGAEGEFEARSGRVYQSNDDGSTGANEGGGNGDQRNFDRSYETGWESERESLRSDRPPYHQGRGDMVASAHTHGTTDHIGLAVMGVRGLHDLGQIIEDDEESEEEKREREARNAGSALGAVVGIAAGLALGMGEADEIDEDEYEDEDEEFDISM